MYVKSKIIINFQNIESETPYVIRNNRFKKIKTDAFSSNRDRIDEQEKAGTDHKQQIFQRELRFVITTFLPIQSSY